VARPPRPIPPGRRPPRPGTNPVKPGRRTYELTTPQFDALQKYLNRPGASALDKQIWKDLANHRPLSNEERARLGTIAQNSKGNLGSGALQAQIDDTKFRQDQAMIDALTGLTAGGLVLPPGADGFPPALIDPGTPAVFYPIAPGGGADGPGIACAVDPGYLDVAAAGEDDLPPTFQAVADDPAGWQTTRFLRVANTTKDKLTLYVQVRTENEEGDWVWAPGAPGSDDTFTYTLDPGQVADVTDNDWRVHGSRARIWAKSDKRNYTAFQGKDLWLVPETNSDGEHGYTSPEVQTFDLAIR
jgi:hypothetical protein